VQGAQRVDEDLRVVLTLVDGSGKGVEAEQGGHDIVGDFGVLADEREVCPRCSKVIARTVRESSPSARVRSVTRVPSSARTPFAVSQAISDRTSEWPHGCRTLRKATWNIRKVSKSSSTGR
jgi:hypothetical protein